MDKRFHFRQTADLAQRAKLGIYQNGDPTGKLLPRERAEVIAEAQLRYFRLLRETIKVAGILSRPNPNIEEIKSCIRNQIMPDANFESEWSIQKSTFENVMQTLAKMLK